MTEAGGSVRSGGLAVLKKTLELLSRSPELEGLSLISTISSPQLLTEMRGASPTDEGIISGFGFFDKLIIEERDWWLKALFRGFFRENKLLP